ncbi:ABC transporter substrate-binding protein [Pseudarthrobacter oxydans]|uniref:ABC transporter substrate-binding protein n=1 Tax=Pseudarthrobacter oxydans TaxID=1671 RepID=UPI00380DFBC7
MRTKIYKATAVLSAALILAGCSNAGSGAGEAPSEGPIKIALVTSLTGAYSPLGEGNLQGAQIAVDEVNAAGGIKGRQVELVVKDDKTVADQSVINVNDAIGDDSVLAILGSPDSNSAVAAAPIAARAQVPYLSQSSNDTLTAKVDPYIFNSPPNTAAWAEKVFLYMKDNKMTKIALAYAEDDVFAVGGHKSSLELAKEHGIDIVVDEAFKTADTEFSGLLQKVRDTAPQAFLFWGTGAAPVIVTKAFADSGIDSQLIFTGAQASTLYSNAVGKAGDGVILDGYTSVIGEYLPEGEQKNEYKKLKTALEAKNLGPVSQFNSDSYSATTLIIEALKSSEELTREGVRDALEKTDRITINGTYKWSPTDHNNSDLDNVAVFEVKDSNFIPAEWQMARMKG